MKKILLAITFLVVIVAMFSFVMAAKPDENGSDNAAAKAEKNMTYGQCVSENAVLKNGCYSSVKAVYSSCKANATDSAVCRTDYKADMKKCKAEFKSAKNECKKIKHNFFETVRYAFA